MYKGRSWAPVEVFLLLRVWEASPCAHIATRMFNLAMSVPCVEQLGREGRTSHTMWARYERFFSIPLCFWVEQVHPWQG